MLKMFPGLPDLNALIFAAYILLLHPQIYFGIRYCTVYYSSLVIIGIVLEIVHWVLRALGRSEAEFVVAGPALIGIGIHLSLKKIGMAALGETIKMDRRLVGLEWAALVLQVGGGLIAWNGRDGMGMMGLKLGLACQSFDTVIIAGIFARLLWTASNHGPTKQDTGDGWPFFGGKSLYLLSQKYSTMITDHKITAAHTMATLCTCLRSLHRLYSLDAKSTEGPSFFVLQGMSMVIAITLLTSFHPGLISHGRGRVTDLCLHEQKR
jgi:hypothetical protein